MDTQAAITDDVRLLERRILLVAPTQRDADAIRAVCHRSGIECCTLWSMPDVCEELAKGAGALVVSEEALSLDPEGLVACLRQQPVWADLPILVLSRSGSESPVLAMLLERVGNVSVVERPVRVSTFLSLVRAALRGRTRQYEVRAQFKKIESVEADRGLLLESERAARAEAERAGRMKDEFLATLSHEIRTPLNAILGWIHILQKTQRADDEVTKGLAVIERNAKAQSQIVADLLDMNLIVSGKVRLHIQRTGLGSAIQAAVDTVTPAADAKGVRLRVQFDPSAGVVNGDPERLQQVFWNLLSNAVKFTPRGGEVRVELSRGGTDAEVSVADTGEGISADFLPYVFDRFRQADGSTTRRHGGLGLGLAIVKQLVELHGGVVRAESGGAGKGSRFFVMLPIAPEGERSSGDVASRAAPAPAAWVKDISGVRILVVDDEHDSRDLLKRLLSGCGARVTTASSVGDAWTLLQRERYEVLISDIGMPDEDGYALVRRLRSLPAERGGRMAAIAVTAYARAEDRENAVRAGFQFHLSKPVEPAELLAAVAQAARRDSVS